MKPDIRSRQDIDRFVRLFYERIKADKQLRVFFGETIISDWNRHEKQLADFWENILFYTGDYEGNPLVTHRRLNARYPTSAQDFKRWFHHFNDTLDALFEGENVQRMKAHAHRIAQIMQEKMG